MIIKKKVILYSKTAIKTTIRHLFNINEVIIYNDIKFIDVTNENEYIITLNLNQ